MAIISTIRARLCKWLCHRDQDGSVTPPTKRDPHNLPLIGDRPRSIREQWLTGHRDHEDDGRIRLRVLLIAGVVLAVVLTLIALWNHHSNPDCTDLVALFNCH